MAEGGRPPRDPQSAIRGPNPMSNLTVVSVGEKTLGVVSARSTPSGVELVRAASAPLPDDFAKSEAGVRAATPSPSRAEIGITAVGRTPRPFRCAEISSLIS